MSRLPRLCPADIPLHVIQRGNNRQICFACGEDYRRYLGFLQDGANAYGVEIHAWVLMTNHIYLLATPRKDGAISRMMQYVGRYYVQYFNQLYSRTGTLWEGRFKSCVVESDSYFFACHRYIELNPVRAHIARNAAEYPWSSHKHNALGLYDCVTTFSESYLSLGSCDSSRIASYRALFSEDVDPDLLSEIREATRKGLAFGSEKFKTEVERLFERRVQPNKPGPQVK